MNIDQRSEFYGKTEKLIIATRTLRTLSLASAEAWYASFGDQKKPRTVWLRKKKWVPIRVAAILSDGPNNYE